MRYIIAVLAICLFGAVPLATSTPIVYTNTQNEVKVPGFPELAPHACKLKMKSWSFYDRDPRHPYWIRLNLWCGFEIQSVQADVIVERYDQRSGAWDIMSAQYNNYQNPYVGTSAFIRQVNAYGYYHQRTRRIHLWKLTLRLTIVTSNGNVRHGERKFYLRAKYY